MTGEVWTALRNAYTPSHMNGGPLRARRQVNGMYAVCALARAPYAPSQETSQADAGTMLRLEPHPRERSVE